MTVCNDTRKFAAVGSCKGLLPPHDTLSCGEVRDFLKLELVHLGAFGCALVT